MRNKKGDGLFGGSIWAGLIIAVVVIFALLFLPNLLKKETPALAKETVCRESIDANTRGHIRGLTIDNEIDCPTNLNPVAGKTNDEKEKEIAERMRACWSKFGEGKSELFAGNKIYCSVCDVFKIEDKQNVKGLQAYILQTNVPNKEFTYMSYFTGYQTEKAQQEVMGKLNPVQLEAVKNADIDGSKTYAVIFVYAKGKDELNKLFRHATGQTDEGKLGFVIGGGAGVAAGATAGFAVLGLSNPIGWAAIAGGAVFLGVEGIFYALSSDNHPEWASFIMLKEYNAQSLKELNCQELK